MWHKSCQFSAKRVFVHVECPKIVGHHFDRILWHFKICLKHILKTRSICSHVPKRACIGRSKRWCSGKRVSAKECKAAHLSLKSPWLISVTHSLEHFAPLSASVVFLQVAVSLFRSAWDRIDYHHLELRLVLKAKKIVTWKCICPEVPPNQSLVAMPDASVQDCHSA